jgi:hypothetical protein
MLNRITAVLLLVTLVSANFSRLFVYAGFELNKKYIAANLCENRDKPWLHCNGQCYFMKKIKQLQENEKSNERQSQKNLFQESYFTSINKVKFYNCLLQTITTPYFSSKQSIPKNSIFQPPRV